MTACMACQLALYCANSVITLVLLADSYVPQPCTCGVVDTASPGPSVVQVAHTS